MKLVQSFVNYPRSFINSSHRSDALLSASVHKISKLRNRQIAARIEVIKLIAISFFILSRHFVDAAITVASAAFRPFSIKKIVSIEVCKSATQSAKLSAAIVFAVVVGFFRPDAAVAYYKQLDLVKSQGVRARVSEIAAKLCNSLPKYFFLGGLGAGFGLLCVSLKSMKSVKAIEDLSIAKAHFSALDVFACVTLTAGYIVYRLMNTKPDADQPDQNNGQIAIQPNGSSQQATPQQPPEPPLPLELPPQAQAQFNGGDDAWSITPEILRESPSIILASMMDWRGGPLNFRYVDSNGNASYASFISHLVEGLIARGTISARQLADGTAELNFLNDGHGFPQSFLAANDPLRGEKIKQFVVFGRLLGKCLKDNIPIGPRFSPILYRLIKVFPYTQLRSIDVDYFVLSDLERAHLIDIIDPNANPNAQQTQPSLRTNLLLQREGVAQWEYDLVYPIARRLANGEEAQNNRSVNTEQNWNWVRKTILDSAPDIYTPAIMIAKGMSESLTLDEWNRP